MKDIYIVISYTGTSISRAIKFCTKNKYTHVSIALDRELDELYSFGRIFRYTIAPAGFVHEGIDTGTFKRFKNTDAIIFSKVVTDTQYSQIKYVIDQMEKDKNKYKFNFIGMIAARLGKKIERANYFYCSEFVKYILNEAKVDISNLPDVAAPEDFMKLDGLKLVYEGLLKDYSCEGKLKTNA